ncbi:MAG: serine/threonine-protein kinase [Gammaproteobacteria bacterium]
MSADERYEIIDDSHGKGGFGQIAKHKDKILERFVAVKRLHMLSDAAARERFKREAKALARMSHPNVPAIYDVQFNDEQMLIFFEFIEGQTLRELIQSGTALSVERARRWFTQVAGALDHAHLKDIIHRDIKPENIVISGDHENATLVDFGIALSADDAQSLTKQGYVIGTPQYMSPEQASGEPLDGRSDLYSLGITLYETLSGHLPHVGGYQPLADQNETIPPAFDELIKECLAQDKNARITSAQEFIKRIRSAFRSDVPLSALLTEARLHEIAAALRQMSPEDFAVKPRGQKLLLVNRLKDLLRTDKPELRTGTAEVIALLTHLARFEGEGEYRPVINAAFEWGFEKAFGPNWQGHDQIRNALIASAKAANEAAHRIVSTEFLAFMKGKELAGLPRWYAHDVRLLVTALLANQNCGNEADDLAVLYDGLNAATH